MRPSSPEEAPCPPAPPRTTSAKWSTAPHRAAPLGSGGDRFLIALLDGFDTSRSLSSDQPWPGIRSAAADMTLVITASTAGMCLGAMVLDRSATGSAAASWSWWPWCASGFSLLGSAVEHRSRSSCCAS